MMPLTMLLIFHKFTSIVLISMNAHSVQDLRLNVTNRRATAREQRMLCRMHHVVLQGKEAKSCASLVQLQLHELFLCLCTALLATHQKMAGSSPVYYEWERSLCSINATLMYRVEF